MNRCFRNTGRLHVLRHALMMDGHDRFDLAQRSDDDVIEAAARRLSGGTWRISYEIKAAPAVLPHVPVPATSPLLGGGSGGSRARTPRRPMPPPSRAPASPGSAPAPVPAPDWPDMAAQVAQAQTLERAARDGTPFCEICDARSRAAEKAAA